MQPPTSVLPEVPPETTRPMQEAPAERRHRRAASRGRVLVVTGTGTGVGKTIVSAALAAASAVRGERVAVLKPVQTGVGPDDPGDTSEISRLVPGTTVRELVRFSDPLAPATAARLAGAKPMSPLAAADVARELTGDHDFVIVEGAGGLLARFDEHGTLADVAAMLGAPVLVVTAAGLGTLNMTELTIAALRHRGLPCPGVVIGAWPVEPDLAARCNLTDLPLTSGVPLLGAVPDGAGMLNARRFAVVARHSLAPGLGGVWQPPNP